MRILAAFVKHVEVRQVLPSGDDLSRAVGCSKRSLYTHFAGRQHLLAEACEVARNGIAAPVEIEFGPSDLAFRVRRYVDRWSGMSENIARLFQALNTMQGGPGDFAPTVRWAAAQRLAEIERYFATELRTLAEPQRSCLIVAIEVLTDFAGWTRLRHARGMKAADIRTIWSSAITRLLAPRPPDEDGACG